MPASCFIFPFFSAKNGLHHAFGVALFSMFLYRGYGSNETIGQEKNQKESKFNISTK